MLFFETDDVTALHASIVARGGKPTGLEKVNWIKFELFGIQDPDGHMLWFGQSYTQPDSPAPRPMLQKSLPELPFDDVAAAVTYYCAVLGFKVNYQQEDLGALYRDMVTILLLPRAEDCKANPSATHGDCGILKSWTWRETASPSPSLSNRIDGALDSNHAAGARIF